MISDSIFKVVIIQVECLLNGTLIHRGDLEKLQQVGDGRTCFGRVFVFLDQVEQSGQAVGGNKSMHPPGLDGCQEAAELS